MLQQIRLLFPHQTPEEKNFFGVMTKIFGELGNAKISPDQILIAAAYPRHAYPQLVIAKSDERSCVLRFVCANADCDANQSLRPVWGNHSATKPVQSFISLPEFYEKLAGMIIKIDHAGLNIPTSLMSEKNWRDLLQKLAQVTNIYNYPTGEPWPFIIPVTSAEFDSDITEFRPGRNPKFELVHDPFLKLPTLQFDLKVNLSRQQVKQLFPEPIGSSFAGLEEFFRTVYVQSPWHDINIRFDLSFANSGRNDNWSTAKWLVVKGKRITQSATLAAPPHK